MIAAIYAREASPLTRADRLKEAATASRGGSMKGCRDFHWSWLLIAGFILLASFLLPLYARFNAWMRTP